VSPTNLWASSSPGKSEPPQSHPNGFSRQFSHGREVDLAWFGVSEKDDRRPTLPEMNNLPSLFGTMYVMEGSTLGGQLIARHVEAALHLSEGRGNLFSRSRQSNRPLWKEFCEMLKLRIPDEQTDTVVVSAKAMFRTFGTWMKRKSAMDGN
jgi:heme oxygenase